jgi:hypothetical protein
MAHCAQFVKAPSRRWRWSLYLVPESLMAQMLASVAALSDDVLVFDKGPTILVDGYGEVHADFNIIALPQEFVDDPTALPSVDDGYGDPQEWTDAEGRTEVADTEEETAGKHTCDCE